MAGKRISFPAHANFLKTALATLRKQGNLNEDRHFPILRKLVKSPTGSIELEPGQRVPKGIGFLANQGLLERRNVQRVSLYPGLDRRVLKQYLEKPEVHGSMNHLSSNLNALSAVCGQNADAFRKRLEGFSKPQVEFFGQFAKSRAGQRHIDFLQVPKGVSKNELLMSLRDVLEVDSETGMVRIALGADQRIAMAFYDKREKEDEKR